MKESKRQEKTSEAMIIWMKNLQLKPTGVRERDIEIKRGYDVKRGMKEAYKKGYETAKNGGDTKDCPYGIVKLSGKTAWFAGVADFENGHKFDSNAFE